MFMSPVNTTSRSGMWMISPSCVSPPAIGMSTNSTPPMVSFSGSLTRWSGTTWARWLRPPGRKYRKGAGPEFWCCSSSGKFACAITVAPSVVRASSPPTWSQCAWVRMTCVIGRTVISRRSCRAAAACSGVLAASMATTPSAVTTKAKSEKS